MGAAWVSDGGFGAVAILSGAGREASQIASELIASDGAACKGDFASGHSSELVDDKVITTALTGCKDSSTTVAVRYFILRATDGGDFIVYELVDNGAKPLPSDSPLQDDRFQSAALKAAFAPC
jgi:hypothetical protein